MGRLRFIKALAVSLLFISACTWNSEKKLKQEAELNEQSGQYQKSLKNYDELIKRTRGKSQSVNFAWSAGQIALLKAKDFEKAIEYFKYVVLNSESAQERIDAQKSLANIYFSHLPLPDYDKAIKEIAKLLSLNLSEQDRFDFSLNLAKSYYRLNNFYQAQVEIDALLESTTDRLKKYDLKKLKADIFLSSKEVDKAITIYHDLLKGFPEESKKDDIALNLAVCYEDQEKYLKAIEILEDMRKTYERPEFIELRIKRLKERQSQQPGAHGLRK